MGGIHYVIKTIDGRTFEGKLGVDVRKTLDKRNRAATHEQPQVVYEVRNAAGVWERVWTDETESVGADIV